ncbi:retinaldehyde-binding protein 1 [Leptinotarsa decemlineata]|uniref:retinaldehyde-binding protein 1 n=1 Tax=Leptinotarsa decemlineata TaxID=7539 RepID=UPI003D30AFC8
MPPDRTNVEEKESLTDEQKQDRFVELRNLIQGEELLKNIDTGDNFLERYFYGTNFSVEDSFKKLKAFRELQIEKPEWFTKEAPLDKKPIIEMNARILLDECDKEGRPIYLAKMGNIDVNKMSMYDVLALDDLWLEFVLTKNPRVTKNGFCMIMDMENCSWKLVKWMSPENVKIGVKKLEALPFNVLKVHVVNNSFVVNTIVRMMWPFLPEKIKNMVVFHFNDWEVLYQHIDQEKLPIEYGGIKKIDYSELYEKLFQMNDEIFRSFASYRTIENT